MDSKQRHNVHQCPGYLREEITLASDVLKSVIVSHAFPSQSEVCSICGQLVQYNRTEPSIVHDEKLEAPAPHHPLQNNLHKKASLSSLSSPSPSPFLESSFDSSFNYMDNGLDYFQYPPPSPTLGVSVGR